jgi:hypothetical protein
VTSGSEVPTLHDTETAQLWDGDEALQPDRSRPLAEEIAAMAPRMDTPASHDDPLAPSAPRPTS